MQQDEVALEPSEAEFAHGISSFIWQCRPEVDQGFTHLSNRPDPCLLWAQVLVGTEIKGEKLIEWRFMQG